MLRNKIKAMKIGFLIVCILPTMSYAFDKEDLLKFLVKSSYPEVKVIDKNEDVEQDKGDTQDVDKEITKEETSSNNEDEEYINVYVGEENIPNTKESITSVDSKYSNDLRITANNPTMLIYHTHSSETYSDSPSNNYHSTDKKNSVMSVGDELTDQLSKKGWGVIHSTTYNDLSYNNAYGKSLKTAQSILSQYSSVKIAIDLHRDGLSITNSNKQSIHDKNTIEINGERVAKFFFVVGQRNENVNELKKEAQEITTLAQKKYPGLVSPVVVKQYGRFNQYIAPNHLLIEIGNNATSTKEAKASCKYIAEILNEYYSSEK